MCARCFSSRRTRPFSAMIWSILSTVVYCVGLRAQIASCTSRTVVGPRLHNTVRISSSASVGLGSFSAIYEELTTKTFVCQGRLRRNAETSLGAAGRSACATGLLLLFADLFARPQQGGRLFPGRGVVLGLFVGSLGRVLLSSICRLPLFLDGGHLGVHGLLLRLFALLYLARAFAQILLGQIQAVGGGLDGLREGELVTPQILGPALLNLLETRKHCLFRRGHGGKPHLDIGPARAGRIRHGIDRVRYLAVLVQRVVDQDRSAGLLLAKQIAHQVQPQFGEIGVQCKPQVRFLRFLDLVDFVGRQKIALRGYGRRQQQTAEQRFHLLLPSIRPVSRSSWTCCRRALALSSKGRSSNPISCCKVSSFLSRLRVSISACLNHRGLLRGFLPVLSSESQARSTDSWISSAAAPKAGLSSF